MYKKEGSALDGAYLIYDSEEDALYYSHKADHNGGRERLAMGIIMAQYLKRHPEDAKCMESLNAYERYVYRELYDENTGVVYNDIIMTGIVSIIIRGWQISRLHCIV